MNDGSPKPINVPMQPWSQHDLSGWSGISQNNYDLGGTAGPDRGDGRATHSWIEEKGVVFSHGQNRVCLSEQIRQTILKGGFAKLVLYGTLIRNSKPKEHELSQPLQTNAVHEAMHSNNPVVDQFLVGNPPEYRGSYLDQYVTGSLLDDPGTAGVAASGWDEDLSYEFSFQRFVTLADESEVYWDSVLPAPVEIWEADNKAPIGAAAAGWPTTEPNYRFFMLNPYYNEDKVTQNNGEILPTDVSHINQVWAAAFPFESRYSDVKRVLLDPGRTTRYRLFPNPTGATGADQQIGWLRRKGSGQLGVVMVSTVTNSTNLVARGSTHSFENGNASQSWLVGVRNTVSMAEARNQNDKATAAVLYGFVSDGEPYLRYGDYEPPGPTHATFLAQYGYGYLKKTLNVVAPGSLTHVSRAEATWDHPHGVKYGLVNYIWQAPAARFRADRYGQFRDMLEQRRYTKFFHRGDDEVARGQMEPAVSCIFVDGNGRPLEDAEKSSCQNISTFMTSSIPYFEGEPATRTPIFSPFVSVDLTSLSTSINSPSTLLSFLN